MYNETTSTPDRPTPGLKRAASSVDHQGSDDEKFTTGEPPPKRLRGREYTSIATWNVRTLSQTGKLKELTHELERYKWHMIGLCETRWKNSGEQLTDEGHMLYYSGEADKHANGVGILMNKDFKNTVIASCPISSRIMSVRVRATPFNITVIQVYAPTTDYTDEELEQFYVQLQ